MTEDRRTTANGQQKRANAQKRKNRRRRALWALAAVALAANIAALCLVSWFLRPLPPALPNGVRVHQYERDSALALLNATPLARFDQMDERFFLRLFIETMPAPYETVALGSSRVLQLTAETLGGSFYNFGVSGADYRDVMNTYYRLEMAGMLPENLIIGLDPWLLRGDGEALHPGSDAALFESFAALCLDANASAGAPPAPAPAAKSTPAAAGDTEPAEALWFKLADTAACQKNLSFFATGLWQPTPPLLAQGDALAQPTQLKMPDGSALYPQRFRLSTAPEVEERARLEATTFLHMDGYTGPDARLAQIFTAFVRRAQKQGVNVIFLLAPYHPIVYRYASENSARYPGFFQMEPWFTALARQCGVPLYGSYNPFVTGNGSMDFYDGLHIKRECLPGVLPPLSHILQSQANGGAGSPWLLGRARVLEETARALVAQYYSIEAPHYLELDGIQPVLGQAGYVYHRYNTEDAGVLYARYAVSVDEGVVWRSDDNLGWVVDPRF